MFSLCSRMCSLFSKPAVCISALTDVRAHTSILNPDAKTRRSQSLDSELSNHKQAKADPASKVEKIEVIPRVYHSVSTSTSPLLSAPYEKNKLEPPPPRSNRSPFLPPVLPAPQASTTDFKRVPAVALWDYTPIHADEMSLVKVPL